MRCPKCQYISFESGPRCRNCGYDFSFSEAPPLSDLPIQTGNEPVGPLAELTLQDSTTLLDRFPAESVSTDANEGRNEPATPPEGRSAHREVFDLPLFRDRATARAEAAVATPPVAPRPPLSVRRPGPRPRRAETRAKPTSPVSSSTQPKRSRRNTAERHASAPTGPAPAPIMPRLIGGLLDQSIMLTIDVAVVYFTLRICELTYAEFTRLPLVPLIAFLMLLNGGYLAVFVAAGGQTIGKMATGTRVIPGDPDARATDRVPFGHAVVRAAAYGLSVLIAGLGFLPGLIGPERRALHDRLADTRVVKA